MGRFGWIPKLFKNALNRHDGDYLHPASTPSPQTHYRSTPHLSSGCNNAATTNANRSQSKRRNGQTVGQVPGTIEHASSIDNMTRESPTAIPHLRNECDNLTNPTAKSSKRTNIQDTIHVATADDHTTSRNKTRLSRRKHHASSPQIRDERCVSPSTSGSDTESKQPKVQQLARARVNRSSRKKQRARGGHYGSTPHLPNKSISRDTKGTDAQDTRHTARDRERRPATNRSTSCPSKAGHHVTPNDTSHYRRSMPSTGSHALVYTCSDWSLAYPAKPQGAQLDKDRRNPPTYGGVQPWKSTNCLLEKVTKAPNVYPSQAPGITNTTSPQQKQSRQPREDRRTPSNRHPPLSKSSADLRRCGLVECPMSGCLSSAQPRSQAMMTERQWDWTTKETSVNQQQMSPGNYTVPMSMSLGNICQHCKLLSPVKFPPTHLNQHT